MEIEVNPTVSRTGTVGGQSVSGRAFCVAVSKDGTRVYLGGHSGVWLSNDGGNTFRHVEKPQPRENNGIVPGAIPVPNIYDLIISPINSNIVLAATGRDLRANNLLGEIKNKNGIYRSEDGGDNWTLVHQFTQNNSGILKVFDVGRLTFAPDDPQLIYAAGGSAVAISNDGGITWKETKPGGSTDRVWYVAVGPLEPLLDGIRRVYAVGTHVWYSDSGGNTWIQDATTLSLGPVSDFGGASPLSLAIHPIDSHVVYLVTNPTDKDRDADLWRGDFSLVASTERASWERLPTPKNGPPNPTASGCTFVLPYAIPNRRLISHNGKPDRRINLLLSDRSTTRISIGEPSDAEDWERVDSELHADPHGLSMITEFKTDIFTVQDDKWLVSFGGTSLWQQINTSDKSIENLRFGDFQGYWGHGTTDFDGDGKTDIFTVHDGKWLVSFGGTSLWQQINTSDKSIENLRFGDFDGDGKTDIFTVHDGKWLVSFGGTSLWQQINTSDKSIENLRFGNFWGKVVLVNDGGVNISVGGGTKEVWEPSNELFTLAPLNMAILPRANQNPAYCIGTGDNSGFFSSDGGEHWKTQDYIAGDNDWCFADPLHPWWLVVFAPRDGLRGVRLYVDPDKVVADGSIGSNHLINIPGFRHAPLTTEPSWNVVSSHTNAGYRPLILTPRNGGILADGDFIAIIQSGSKIISGKPEGGTAKLCRTTSISTINSPNDWLNLGSPLDPNFKVFQEGPDLPDPFVNIVQASGGHESPVFYAGDILRTRLTDPGESPPVGVDVGGQMRLWKWKKGMSSWQQIVPAASGSFGPSKAKRFFVDPYRPDVLYVLDTLSNHIFKTKDGGLTWIVDNSLENALTEGGNFPFTFRDFMGQEMDLIGQDALLRDMIFDPDNPNLRFACGPAGVFRTQEHTDVNWDILISTVATPMHPTSLTYDFVSSPNRRFVDLYVSTNNRGLLGRRLFLG